MMLMLFKRFPRHTHRVDAKTRVEEREKERESIKHAIRVYWCKCKSNMRLPSLRNECGRSSRSIKNLMGWEVLVDTRARVGCRRLKGRKRDLKN